MFYNFIFYSETKQKVRCTTYKEQHEDEEFEFVGKLTKTEFDLLIEILFEKFGDEDISLDQFVRSYLDIRDFSDQVKTLVNDKNQNI
tara:strand:+ start:4499 stop:4759 length:261 start_codon:yes stop_codon:yes gene_type:complete